MNVWVRGTGITAFGELWNESVESLVATSVHEALVNAKMKIEYVDAVVVGNMLLPQLEQRAHVGKIVADALHFRGPSLAVEGACASGGLAIRQGIALIESKLARRVLVVGVEKMSDVSPDIIGRALMSAGSSEEQWAGATFPCLYALITRAYMDTYHLTDEDMAKPAVLGHAHAIGNIHAQFRQPITAEDVLRSSLIADPIRQLNASPISDGAAAVLLEAHTEGDSSGIAIVGSGHGGDWLNLAKRTTITSMHATKVAVRQALTQAKTTIANMDVVEVHDCFSVALLIALEDLGFCEGGKAGLWLDQGHESKVNPSGGLKACGHPVGATGVKQVVEIARQLENKTYGLTHNVSGSGATAVVHVLRRRMKNEE